MLLFLLDAPANNLEGKLSGDIRAIKWKHYEGVKHKGCKGTVLLITANFLCESYRTCMSE